MACIMRKTGASEIGSFDLIAAIRHIGFTSSPKEKSRPG
jgi:hypothetical protein